MSRWPDPIFPKAGFLRRSWPVGFSKAFSRCSAFNPSQLDESTGTSSPQKLLSRESCEFGLRKHGAKHAFGKPITPRPWKKATWHPPLPSWSAALDAPECFESMPGRSHKASRCCSAEKNWGMNPTNLILELQHKELGLMQLIGGILVLVYVLVCYHHSTSTHHSWCNNPKREGGRLCVWSGEVATDFSAIVNGLLYYLYISRLWAQ